MHVHDHEVYVVHVDVRGCGSGAEERGPPPLIVLTAQSEEDAHDAHGRRNSGCVHDTHEQEAERRNVLLVPNIVQEEK